jgi:ribosomal protein S18 acetylase RimI-like enzyme
MHPYTLRTAHPDDYPHIITLLQGLAQEEQGTCLLDVAALSLQVQSANPPLWIWVAAHTEADSSEQGVCACILAYAGYDVLSASRGLHVSDVVVAPDMRNIGVGTALMRRLAAEALQEGLEWMSWTTLCSNHDAQRFYQRIGGNPVNVQFMAMGRSAMQRLQF